MNLEDQLIVLFQRTLESSKDDHLQTILASQAKIIQQKKENMVPQIMETAVQKKMQAFEKSFVYNDPSKKRRRSKYDNASHNETTDENNELQLIRRENARIQSQIANLEYRQRESYLKSCNQIEQLRKEKSEIHELQKKLDDKLKNLNNRQTTLTIKDAKLQKQEDQIMGHRQQIEECLQEQQRDDQLLNQRREIMEQLQIQLNTSVSELLGCSQRLKLNVQIDAIEYLVKSTLKERNALSTEQQYLRQFKNKVIEEKKQIMKLKEQVK